MTSVSNLDRSTCEAGYADIPKAGGMPMLQNKGKSTPNVAQLLVRCYQKLKLSKLEPVCLNRINSPYMSW
jgi:hypothetical protein